MANMHSTSADAHDDGHGVGHVVPVRYLVATGLALLVLTVVTVWVAGFDFGAANIFVALLIAGFKASLVVLFFMHLRWDRPFNSFIFVASIAFVVLFIAFALTDTIEYSPDLIEGDAPLVETRLTELSAE